jgi:hypothetical protein
MHPCYQGAAQEDEEHPVLGGALAARRPKRIKEVDDYLKTPDEMGERCQWDALMERYKIPDYDYFLDHWSLAQVYVAVDAMFWNSLKEKDKYGAIPRPFDPTIRAGGIFKSMGMWNG